MPRNELEPNPAWINAELGTVFKKPRLEQDAENLDTSGILSLSVEIFDFIYRNPLVDMPLIKKEEVIPIPDRRTTPTFADVSCPSHFVPFIILWAHRNLHMLQRYKKLSKCLERTSSSLVENPHRSVHVQSVMSCLHHIPR